MNFLLWFNYIITARKTDRPYFAHFEADYDSGILGIFILTLLNKYA